MDFGKGASTVERGTACRHRKELPLHGDEFAHGDMGEIIPDLGVGDDFCVETLDQFFHAVGTADSFVERFFVGLESYVLRGGVVGARGA